MIDDSGALARHILAVRTQTFSLMQKMLEVFLLILD